MSQKANQQTQCRAEKIALDLISRGFAPVPVPIGKRPTRRQWQTLRITAAEVPKYFHDDGLNVGAIMGAASGHLTDIDLDCLEAMELAPHFLPETHSIYGRASKHKSHWLYTCKDCPPKGSIKLNDEENGCVAEVRMGGGDKGAQSVMPFSLHVSGESYRWDEDGPRSEVKFIDLKTAAVKIGTMLIRHWPPLGSRHDAALALGGLLARTGWKPEDIEHFVTSVCDVHGEATDPAAHGKSARDSANTIAAGGEAYGMPKMIELFGAKVMKKIAQHLGYNTRGQSPEPPTRKDGLPIVKFGPLSKMADRAAEILIKAAVAFFQRGAKLVRPVVLPMETFGSKSTSAAQLVEVDIYYLRDMLCRNSRWVQLDQRSQTWVDIHPPQDVAMVLLKRFGDWEFPIIAGIITTPTLRPDGTILSMPGYDPATRLLLVDPPTMPPIADRPTRNDAMAALQFLKGPLREFPFVDVDADNKSVSRAVALSAYLSTVCRGAFAVVPMHVVDAPAPGSGKSYLLSTVSWIATGQAMPVISAGKSEEEMEKRVGAAVIRGQSLVCVDNVSGAIGGDALCQLIEQPRPSVRILGQSQLIDVDARAITYFANGNNIIVVGDFCRRAIRSRLDPRIERPELKQFKGNPMREILANRGAYIAAALTICRAYMVAGRPNKLPQLASFGEWSDTVRSALVWLGEADPVTSLDLSQTEDPEKSALITMLNEWRDVFGVEETTAVTLRDVIDHCERTYGAPTDYVNRGLRAAVLAIMPAHQRQKPGLDALGYWMRAQKDRRVSDMWFNKTTKNNGPHEWWLNTTEAEAKAKEEQAKTATAAAV